MVFQAVAGIEGQFDGDRAAMRGQRLGPHDGELSPEFIYLGPGPSRHTQYMV